MLQANGESRQNLEFLGIQYKSLHAIGLDLGVIRGRDIVKNRQKFTILAVITFYLQCGLFVYAAHMFTIQIDKASTSLSLFNQGSLLCFKMFILLLRSDRLLKFIWDLNMLATMANDAEEELWLSENRYSKLIAKVYGIACLGATIASGLLPIVFILYEHFRGLEVNPFLPFDGEFPYEHLGLPIFILNYILSTIYVWTLLGMTIGMDTLFGWFVYAVSGHFRILCSKVAVTAAKIAQDDNHADFIRDVGSIVYYHNKILGFVNELNGIFGPIFWAEVAFSCLQMCFLIFNLNSGTDMRQKPFNLLVFLAISIQLMIYCFGGQKVKSENEALCNDIYYQFPWDKMKPSEKKMMLLPLMRSQEDTALRGLFFELDRNLLVYIYRTAFSYNTLLAAMKDN
uniref:Odorant receptor n=1 Tax=Stomoxys calcitrans TaxID=35570 RepID=A0A1I8PEX3_STOCA